MESTIKKKRAEVVQDYNPDEPTIDMHATLKNVNANLFGDDDEFGQDEEIKSENPMGNIERDADVDVSAVIKDEQCELAEGDMDVELKMNTVQNFDEYEAAMRLKQGTAYDRICIDLYC